MYKYIFFIADYFRLLFFVHSMLKKQFIVRVMNGFIETIIIMVPMTFPVVLNIYPIVYLRVIERPPWWGGGTGGRREQMPAQTLAEFQYDIKDT